nr:MAG TPA: hypothetical protein [Caudoviricetes sp.]
MYLYIMTKYDVLSIFLIILIWVAWFTKDDVLNIATTLIVTLYILGGIKRGKSK